MSSLLVDTLDVVLAGTPSALVPSERVPALRATASRLPPIMPAGFELRLGSGGPVDLGQNIGVSEGLPGATARHLAQRLESGGGGLAPGWDRIIRFCLAWEDPATPWREQVREISLELDLDTPSESLPIPSVFVGLTDGDMAAGRAPSLLEDVLAILLPRPPSPAILDSVQRCVSACPRGARISHFGAMLSRPNGALRLNMMRVAADSVESYLRAIEWPGEVSRVDAILDRLFPLVDHVYLALDLTPGVGRRLGLECAFQNQPDVDSRWSAFLDEIVQLGCCDPGERDTLLAWPRTIVPPKSPAPWPCGLIAGDMARPDSQFSTIVCGLSHIKIDVVGEERLRAKAYLFFQPDWVAANGRSRDDVSAGTRLGAPPGFRAPAAREILWRETSDSSLVPAGDAAERPNRDRLDDAIQRAIVFLLDTRRQPGWWYDFPRNVRGSDGWVTAFVGAMVATVPDRKAQLAARRAWSLLERGLPPEGGWGYSRMTPGDADSTAWGLRLAAAVGAEGSERAQRARRFLEGHVLPNGGLRCYREEVLPLPVALLGVSFRGSRDGWCHTAHSCITAAAAFLGAERPLAFLRRSQEDDGSWKAFWWEDTEYATALAAEALARTGRAADQVQVERAVRWAVERVGPTGAVYSARHGADSPFATAWCVRTLALAEDPAGVREPLERSVHWLLDTQRANGAWSPSARLRVPFPDVINPEMEPSTVFLDDVGVFTAATVVSALDAARSCLSHTGGGAVGLTEVSDA